MRRHRTPMRGSSAAIVSVTSSRARRRPSRSVSEGGRARGRARRRAAARATERALEAPSRSHGCSCPRARRAPPALPGRQTVRSNRARGDSRTCTSTRRPPTSTIRIRATVPTESARARAQCQFRPRLGTWSLDTAGKDGEMCRKRNDLGVVRRPRLQSSHWDAHFGSHPPAARFTSRPGATGCRPCTATRSTARGFSRC